MGNHIKIRKATPDDADDIWNIIRQVIAKGDTYVFAPNSPRAPIMDYWCGAEKHTYVATIDEKVVGTFVMKDNFEGLGSHVANASYMADPSLFGKGIGSAMGKFSIAEAKRIGYKSMQFNIVVKTNVRAVALWQRLGFKIIGESPEAFNHSELGLVNTLIMWQKL